MTIFNTIGNTYNNSRTADERIVAALTGLLNLPESAIIADIGAGSGNYTQALAARGYRLKAVEPAEAMRLQAAPSHRIEWFPGVAEQIPLADASVDGVIVTLAIHHFSDLKKAFAEIARIATTGPLVIFTFDPRIGQETWLADYFPTMWQSAFEAFPPVHHLAGLLEEAAGRPVDVVPFHLPHDLQDNFAAAGWRTPQRYLESSYRENMSPFRLMGQEVLAMNLDRLSRELEDGTWQRQYGHTLQWDEIDAGYCFLRVRPAA